MTYQQKSIYNKKSDGETAKSNDETVKNSTETVKSIRNRGLWDGILWIDTFGADL